MLKDGKIKIEMVTQVATFGILGQIIQRLPSR
jgi:hypothetical protein